MYEQDKRIVMTLDAGGTNFVFSAIQGCKEIISPIGIPAVADNLEGCLLTLVEGFEQVKKLLPEPPVAISFAFPGPADYKNGIIGDLPNFPAFRGGVALGPFLQKHFDIPVYINNDGDLFAYGEALAGALPELNAAIKAAGGTKQYKNLLGITFGTGFGGGVVVDGKLLTGDNNSGGNVWCCRHKDYTDKICEEGVSVRAVKRVYGELAGVDASNLTPKDIFDIAEGTREGDAKAAAASFAKLGEIAANTMAQAVTLCDGVMVIGGGIAAAHKYIIPAMMAEFISTIGRFSGDTFPRMEMKVYDLTDMSNIDSFVKDASVTVKVPVYGDEIVYDKEKRSAIMVSKLGASKAINLGAYTFALAQIDA